MKGACVTFTHKEVIAMQKALEAERVIEKAETRMQHHPLTPQDALLLQPTLNDAPTKVPPGVYKAINQLILENFCNGFARIQRLEAIELITAYCQMTRTAALKWCKHVLPDSYACAGWGEVIEVKPNGQPRFEGMYFDPAGFYYVFAVDPILSNEALWKKYHPDEPMPDITPLEVAHALKKMTPGYGGWKRDVEEKYAVRTERARLEYMEQLKKI